MAGGNRSRWVMRAGASQFFELPCYDSTVFNFGKPKTVGDWMVHIAGAIVAIFLVWWMLRVYVL